MPLNDNVAGQAAKTNLVHKGPEDACCDQDNPESDQEAAHASRRRCSLRSRLRPRIATLSPHWAPPRPIGWSKKVSEALMLGIFRQFGFALLLSLFALAGCANGISVEAPTFNTPPNDNDMMDY